MDGLIIVNKEKGMTSHDVVNQIRKIFHTSKVGHLGTLDPLATGVLVVCINNATKLGPYLENVTKEYFCELIIGQSSNTFDTEGMITNSLENFDLDEEKFDKILQSFVGTITQTPPIYSAVKIKGKKLYEYARNNIEVDIPTREVQIYEAKRLTKISYENKIAKTSFFVKVSKGTYIRSLCHDIGIKLGIPTMMAGLNRTASGMFTIDMASTLTEIQNGHFQLISMLDALNFLPMFDNPKLVNKALNGMKISLQDITLMGDFYPPQIVIKNIDQLVAIYELDLEKKCYKAARVWR